MHNNQCNARSGSQERMKRSCKSFRPALLNGNPGGLCGRQAINSRSVGKSSPCVLVPKLPRIPLNRPLETRTSQRDTNYIGRLVSHCPNQFCLPKKSVSRNLPRQMVIETFFAGSSEEPESTSQTLAQQLKLHLQQERGFSIGEQLAVAFRSFRKEQPLSHYQGRLSTLHNKKSS